jgi:hypothetical protein
MPVRRSWLALGTYLLLALAVLWPLPARLATHLPGPPSGDTGVYVWNLWVFQHELERGVLPFSTSTIFSLLPRTDLSFHNYTVLPNVFAAPLVATLGPVPAYNLLVIGFVALNGFCAFLLARHVTGRTLESWLAGALFAASPVLIARTTAHFSLVAAFGLPLSALAATRALETGRWRDVIATGAALATAALCDAYYGVFAALLVGGLVGARVLTLGWVRRETIQGFMRPAIDIAILTGLGVVAGISLTGGTRLDLFGRKLVLETLYTPVLLLTLLFVLRGLLRWKPRLVIETDAARMAALRLVGGAALVCSVLVSPTLFAMGAQLANGQFEAPPTLWRSSPPGVDLLAFVMPNPNHPWFGAPFEAWLRQTRPDGFAEFTAALPLTALICLLIAACSHRAPLPRPWLGLAMAFASLSLGPFVQVAGVNTLIPGPWALLRYVPVVGLARSPSRFAVVATLLVAVLFAAAVAAIRERARRPALVTAIIIALLGFELWPAPRPLAAASVPSVLDIIRADPDSRVRVLHLPTGIRDGASSLGDFSAKSQFYQTYHEKKLIGGYLSRVPGRKKRSMMSFPFTSALITLSQGHPLTPEQEYRAWRNRGRFLHRSHLGYVVFEHDRTPPALRRFAIQALELEFVAEDEGYELWRPRRRPLPPGRPPGWDVAMNRSGRR